jgi:hypothetical protein
MGTKVLRDASFPEAALDLLISFDDTPPRLVPGTGMSSCPTHFRINSDIVSS